MTLTVTTLVLVTVTILCSSIAQLLQKQAASQLKSECHWYSLAGNAAFIQSIVLLACGMATWLMVLRELDVSVAYPLLSVNFILVPVLARWKFDEHIPVNRIYGSVIIVAGLSVLFSG